MHRWWMVAEARRAIDEALYSKMRAAGDAVDAVTACRDRFDALNIVFSAHDDLAGQATDEHATGALHRSLQRLITTGLLAEDRWSISPDPPRRFSGEGLTIRGKGALTWENSG